MYSELLTPREKDIIELICKGYTNKQIAESLFIEPCTVITFTGRIMQKFNISTFDRLEKNVKRLRMALCYLKEHPELLEN